MAHGLPSICPHHPFRYAGHLRELRKYTHMVCWRHVRQDSIASSLYTRTFFGGRRNRVGRRSSPPCVGYSGSGQTDLVPLYQCPSSSADYQMIKERLESELMGRADVQSIELNVNAPLYRNYEATRDRVAQENGDSACEVSEKRSAVTRKSCQ